MEDRGDTMTDDEINAKVTALQAQLDALKTVPAASEWQAWAKGTLQSWTAWFGAALIAWPAIQPQLQPLLEQTIGAKNTGYLVSLAGVIVILLRVKTTTSLKDKGAPS